MFNKWRRYSYAAQKEERHRIRWILLFILAFFLVYTLLTQCFFSLRSLQSESMQPGLRRGDCLIFSSHLLYQLLPPSAGAGRLRRGDIVLVKGGEYRERRLLFTVLEPLVRFFSAQRMSLQGEGESFFVKRVIALPGDEIWMNNFVVRVKPAGAADALTEFEYSPRPYDVTIPQVPALWDESLPFSGKLQWGKASSALGGERSLVLGPQECFVLSDDRSNTNDSRTWGPVTLQKIAGKALFRYWPLTRLGLP